jgi:hypothetical protein
MKLLRLLEGHITTKLLKHLLEWEGGGLCQLSNQS